MNRRLSLASLALAAVAAIAACSGAASGPPVPSLPVATASVAPSPDATPSSAPDPSPGRPLTVDLATATGHHVSIEILDDGGHVVRARSGVPGDGASVPFGSVAARNLDAQTVQLTWSDTPGDARLGLYVSERLDVVLVIRPERPAGDAIAFDRVLVVEFDRPVDATALHLGVQEGLDTAG